MTTFHSHMNQIAPASPATTTSHDGSGRAEPPANPHAGPTPVDLAALFRLLQDQFMTLLTDAPTEANRDLLRALVEALELDIARPPERPSLTQEYLDTLERVSRRALKPDDTCPICVERYLDDPYPLVVELPCHGSHQFALECVGPWLLAKGSCPLCRKDLRKEKGKERDAELPSQRNEHGDYHGEDDEFMDAMYG